MTNQMATLRQLLVEKPGWSTWNQLVSLLDEWPKGEGKAMAVEYARNHLDASWPDRERVGNHSWAEDSKGWELLKGETRQVEVSPAMEESWIPAGQYWMGANEESHDIEATERPQRLVRLTRGFWMMTMPITEEVWQWVQQEEPSNNGQRLLPKTEVSWFESIRFCNALSEKHGLQPAYLITEYDEYDDDAVPDAFKEVEWDRDASGWRLPTEAEWEWAARAGATGQTYAGELRDGIYQENNEGVITHSSVLGELGWYHGNSDDQKQPVGKKKPNAWGLHDIVGNVFEWCYDHWNPIYTFDGSTPLVDLVHEEKDIHAERVQRGGAWYFYARVIRLSSRYGFAPSERSSYAGLRLVRNGSSQE